MALPALEALAAVVTGGPVTVLGSAPLEAPLTVEGRLLAVNGGIASSPGEPDVWFCNARRPPLTWSAARQRLNRLMLAQAAGRTLPLVIFLSKEPGGPCSTLERLGLQGTTVRAWQAITGPERRALEREAGARDGGEHKATSPSAGLTVAALALLAGASAVHLRGISWCSAYAYLPGEVLSNTRGHVEPDRRALRNLEARYGAAVRHGLTTGATKT